MGFIVWCGGSVAIQSANAATMFHTIGSAVIAFVINHYSLLTLVTVGILAINKMGDVILETADATLTFARDVATFGIAVSAVTASFSFKGLIMLSGHMYRFIQQSLEYATQERDIQQNLIVCLDE